MSPLFVVVKRTGCFAISDPPTVRVVYATSAAPGISVTQAPFAYHLGVRLGLWRACLVILTYDFFLVSSSSCDVTCHLISPWLKFLLATRGLVRWPQHVRDGVGESDDCCLVYLNNNRMIIDIALRSGTPYPRLASPEYPETRQVVICPMRHRRGLLMFNWFWSQGYWSTSS